MHALGARRRGERSVIRIVVQVAGQQILRVEYELTDLILLVARNLIPYFRQRRRLSPCSMSTATTTRCPV